MEDSPEEETWKT